MANVINENKNRGHHIPWLPIIRMAIVALIAFGYVSTMPRGPSEDEYLQVFGYDPSWYGVTLLFMVSGYLALRSLYRHGSGAKMFMSRLARNFPGVLIFALSVIFILYPLFGSQTVHPTTAQKFEYFLKVVSCVNPNALTPGLLDHALYSCIIQGGLWTFKWGLIAYIGTAIMWHLGVLKQRRLLLVLTIFVTALYAWFVSYFGQNPDVKFKSLVTLTRLAWPFLAGMSMYAYRDSIPRTWLIPLILFALASIKYFFFSWTPYIEILFELAFGYIVFLGITSPRLLPESLKDIPDLSLGMYIFNWPVAQISLLLIPAISSIELFAITFPITVLIAYGLWWFVNRPVNIRVRQFVTA